MLKRQYTVTEQCLNCLPVELLTKILEYIPQPIRKTTPTRLSPNAERDLRKIQKSMLRGKNDMYMRDLEEFLLE
jgi:hypothetical protein